MSLCDAGKGSSPCNCTTYTRHIALEGIGLDTCLSVMRVRENSAHRDTHVTTHTVAHHTYATEHRTEHMHVPYSGKGIVHAEKRTRIRPAQQSALLPICTATQTTDANDKAAYWNRDEEADGAHTHEPMCVCVCVCVCHRCFTRTSVTSTVPVRSWLSTLTQGGWGARQARGCSSTRETLRMLTRHGRDTLWSCHRTPNHAYML